MDLKDFGIGAQILHELHINKLRVITNSSQGQSWDYWLRIGNRGIRQLLEQPQLDGHRRDHNHHGDLNYPSPALPTNG